MKEIIDFMICILMILVCVIVYNLCYAKLNNKKFNFNLNNILLSLTAAIFVTINNNFSSIGIKTILNLAILSSELKLIFKEEFRKVIINYMLIFLFISLIEIVTTNILLYMGVLTNNNSANQLTLLNLLLSILMSVLEYLIISINWMKKLIQTIIKFFIKNKSLTEFLYLIFIAIFIIDAINVYTFANAESFKLILILVLIFTILFITIIRLKFNEELLKISNRKLIDYNDNYAKFLDDYKIYKHNINHKLAAMKSFGNKKINALIDDLLEEETTFSIKNNELYNIPNGIKGIVAEKLYNKDYHVMINNKIKKDPFIKLNARSFNSISECIGIALDNAVEASEVTEEPIILLDLNEDNENIYLKIGNNYCNSIDLDNIGNKYYSTKNRGSGLGLFSIKQNNLVKEKIEIINNFYYIELQIKKAR